LADVEHVALLARLRLTDEEKLRLTGDLNIVLDHFEVLQALDTSDVPPTSHPMVLRNVLRRDEPAPSLPRESFLSQAPDARDEFFVAPRVVET
jgi:aspartyl-tRNA(Asn)/glutamyl-tRNA(Gln) amidotransferase subunit C